MLVLSRKLNETIIIADNIRVTVVGIRHNQVRLGIEAPTQVAIYREELCLPTQTVEEAAEPASPLAPLRQSVRHGR
jgi:carbon storage regulator